MSKFFWVRLIQTLPCRLHISCFFLLLCCLRSDHPTRPTVRACLMSVRFTLLCNLTKKMFSDSMPKSAIKKIFPFSTEKRERLVSFRSTPCRALNIMLENIFLWLLLHWKKKWQKTTKEKQRRRSEKKGCIVAKKKSRNRKRVAMTFVCMHGNSYYIPLPFAKKKPHSKSTFFFAPLPNFYFQQKQQKIFVCYFFYS